MQIGIYDGCGFNIKFDETTKFLGGSETWLLEISKALSDLGHEVFLFCNPPKFHTYKSIHFISKTKLKEMYSIITFDKFIYSRGIEQFNNVKAKEISLFLHDMGITNYKQNLENFKKIKNVYVLSDWHRNNIIKNYNQITKDKIKLSFNGVDQVFYKNKHEKTNSMIWSSCFERGLDFFITHVYPKIKKSVPDFTLKICSYNKYTVNYPGIIYLGQLSKKALAEEQLKSKIWCYPNLGYTTNESRFKETFCISAVENALAGNCILTTDLGGLGTTCKGIEFLSNDFYVNEKIVDFEKYGNYLAEYCIKALNNKFFTSFDATKYSWNNAALGLLDEYNI